MRLAVPKKADPELAALIVLAEAAGRVRRVPAGVRALPKPHERARATVWFAAFSGARARARTLSEIDGDRA